MNDYLMTGGFLLVAVAAAGGVVCALGAFVWVCNAGANVALKVVRRV
ncbi:hypothetical protein DNAM_670 [Pseudomonas phage BroderSalsa]|nr:hypothetical protein DNAM_670 [Pseudomonas phage BroderSalsa]